MSHTSPNQPGLTPPPGVTPDFDSPFTLQPYQALVVAACVAFTTTALAARLYTKARIIKAVVWEDCERLPQSAHGHKLAMLTLARFFCDRMGTNVLFSSSLMKDDSLIRS